MEHWVKKGVLCGSVLFFSFESITLAQAYEKEPSAENQKISEIGETDWLEGYTDTDELRGTLAVRLETFEGFHGTTELVVRKREGEREWKFSLKPETGYRGNWELPVGEYHVVGIQAVSEGRVFDCKAEPGEMILGEGETEVCKIHVFPASVYYVPYEETEEERENIRSDAGKRIDDGETERDNEEQSEETNHRADHGEGSSQEEMMPGIPLLFFVGLLGFLFCTVWMFRFIKRKQEGDF